VLASAVAVPKATVSHISTMFVVLEADNNFDDLVFLKNIQKNFTIYKIN